MFVIARSYGRSSQRPGVTYAIRAVRAHGLIFWDFYSVSIECCNFCNSKVLIATYNLNVAGTKVSSLYLLVCYECGWKGFLPIFIKQKDLCVLWTFLAAIFAIVVDDSVDLIVAAEVDRNIVTRSLWEMIRGVVINIVYMRASLRIAVDDDIRFFRPITDADVRSTRAHRDRALKYLRRLARPRRAKVPPEKSSKFRLIHLFHYTFRW